ncbi:hypothetical protein NitYY0918_C0223 [Nitratiruptor sp. YY09-18]|nr:hypothetical protein NitYY0918_C0223 [Nitratiruptor sp. YY09-18]
MSINFTKRDIPLLFAAKSFMKFLPIIYYFIVFFFFIDEAFKN